MRLLVYRNCQVRYGAEEHLLRMARHMAARGWRVTATFPRTAETSSMIRECVDNGIAYSPLAEVKPVPPFAGYPARLKDLAGRLWLLGQVLANGLVLIRNQPARVLVVCGAQTESPSFLLACALLRIPTVVVFQNVIPGQSFNPELVGRLDWITRRQRWYAVSQQNKQDLDALLPAGSEPLEILYNGIETQTPFSALTDREISRLRAEVRKELGLAESVVILLSVGRLDPQKGHQRLAEAVPAVVESHPDVRFVWVGTGSEEARLREQLRGAGCDHLVLFLGYRTDVLRLMKAADLLVFPSLFEGGCSNTIREAMVHGLPLVASDAGGIPEVVESGRHGVLYSVDKPAELKNSIVWALGNPDAMNAMRDQARVRIGDFSVERMADDYAKALGSRDLGSGQQGLRRKSFLHTPAFQPDSPPLGIGLVENGERPDAVSPEVP